ncbi:hypothetical protein RB195_019869 [Necator americanus]|uniref:Ig-like domain-containing protein n=1 Tax=Necator americanus TaxID=51031 RepID=A0ABR1CI31_NECAM
MGSDCRVLLPKAAIDSVAKLADNGGLPPPRSRFVCSLKLTRDTTRIWSSVKWVNSGQHTSSKIHTIASGTEINPLVRPSSAYDDCKLLLAIDVD